MEQEITIVTAFFNVDREHWKGFERSQEKYFSYFSYWARLRNRLVVFVENEENAAKVRAIRASFGLEDRTEVVVTGNCEQIVPDLFESLRKVSLNSRQKYLHLYPGNPEAWNFMYNYVILLKTYCVYQAIVRQLADGMCAWMDFGFGHGEQTYKDAGDFDFLWKYDFSDKITFFTVKDLDRTPLILTILSMDTYITGAVQVGPAEAWLPYWQEMKKSMMELNDIGLMDDDQTIMQICYNKAPEKYTVLPSGGGFFTPLQLYGGSHLRLQEGNYGLVRKAAHRTKQTMINRRYAEHIFTSLQDLNL